MIETLLAGGVVAVCALLLLRLMIGDVRRYKLDAAVLRRWRSVQRRLREAWQWRAVRRAAAREAEDVIHRARHGARRDGNVIRPKQFESPKKPH